MFQPSGFSLEIFKSRYALTEAESWEQCCERVARQMSLAEQAEEQSKYQAEFNTMLVNNLFVPGGRILYNSGRNNPNLLNCFVLANELDSKEGWGNIAKEVIVTSMKGGGCGIDFSDVRPKGSPIHSQRGECPGPVSLMELVDAIANPVRSGGTRRVALMFSMDLDHPDVIEFLDAKLTKGKLTNANVSIRSKNTTKFIEAVKNDGDWELSWKGKYKKTIKAKDLWDKIVVNAYNSAEPGFLNWELVEKESNISYINQLVTTNPCFTGDTKIKTNNGYQKLVDLKDKKDIILTNYLGQNVPGSIWSNGIKKLVSLNLSNGKIIRCTPDHVFMDNSGNSVQAKDLNGLCLMSEIGSKDSPVVVSVNEDGEEEEVFDFNLQDDTHWGIIEGVVAHNCGEIAMSSYDSCCLGHLVLPNFVTDNKVDWKLLSKNIKLAVRFLDNVLSVNYYPLIEMKRESNKLRRIGMGTTGLADMLTMLGIKYGGEQGNKFIDKLFNFISKRAYLASIKLAKEKTMFSACIPSEHIKSDYIQRSSKTIQNLILKYGIRNCCLLTQAPTGTVSILSGNCSAGIEPAFAAAYERNYFDKDVRKKTLEFHPLFFKMMSEGKDVSSFVSAREIAVREHMEVQSIVQRYIDNAVSKTIQMGQDYPMDDMSECWLEYLPKLKGTTFFRENTRGYVDSNGVTHDPPLVALSLEEAIARFKTQTGTISDGIVDCENGLCDI